MPAPGSIKAETAAEKPSFRRQLRRRCVFRLSILAACATAQVPEVLNGYSAPWKKLTNEKPKGETIAYNTLLNAWKAGKVR
jgi:hypothetical protein